MVCAGGGGSQSCAGLAQRKMAAELPLSCPRTRGEESRPFMMAL